MKISVLYNEQEGLSAVKKMVLSAAEFQRKNKTLKLTIIIW
jgi:hypothetical protein